MSPSSSPLTFLALFPSLPPNAHPHHPFLSLANTYKQVQLLLSDFALLKTDGGHALYVAFRNAMGV